MIWEQPVTFKAISADTATFVLGGGSYTMTCVGANYGTVDLKLLAADGSTYFSVLAAAFAANGLKSLSLAPGVYKVVVASTTGVYTQIAKVPT